MPIRFECTRDELARAISVPVSITPSRTPKQSLQSITLRTAAGKVQVEASDGDLWARTEFAPTSIVQEGEIALMGTTFDAIVQGIEARAIAIEAQGRFCEIRSEDALYNLVLQEAGGSANTGSNPKPKFSITRDQLEEMFTRTVVAVGKDSGRYAVNGIMFEFEDSVLSMISTDSRRMSRATRRVQSMSEDGKPCSAIVPLKAIHETLRGTREGETIEIGFDDQFLGIQAPNLTLSSRLIVGDFPDHRRIIPTEHRGAFSVNRDSLLAAIRKTAVFTSEMMKFVHFDVTDGSLTIAAEADGRGRASTKMPAELRGPSQISVDLNPDFLVDYLKVLQSGIVNFEFRDSQNAFLLRQEGTSDVYLVMPITAN